MFKKVSLFALILSVLFLVGCGGSDGVPIKKKQNEKKDDTKKEKKYSIKAIIISPKNIKSNDNITISATGTITDSIRPLAYNWKVIKSPKVSSGIIKTPTARATKFIAKQEGIYEIKLTVSDGITVSTVTKEIKADLDGDGILSKDDQDIDGDGILNKNDAFPKNITEWVDSDKNGIGNYAQTDEDGDGVKDEIDNFPFDANKTTLSTFSEVEFNGNLYPDGNKLNRTYPFRISGSIEKGSSYQVDTDYFLFNAKAGDMITITLETNSTNFKPTIALLDSLGSTQTTVKIDSSDKNFHAISTRISSDGEYAISVSDMQNRSSKDFKYIINVFKDSDMDGLSDQLELAMGMQPISPDSDHDGISDGIEFRASKGNFDQDSDNIPAWWDNDSDNDTIDDHIETFQDVDGDGIANFLDMDSDGNSLDDEEEFGDDPNIPIDTDGDGIYDFVDLDDDNDGLLDINDNDRTKKATMSNLDDKNKRLLALDFITIISQDQNISNVARIGDSIKIEGEGFTSDSLILWETPQSILNIKPISSTNNSISFTIPKDAQSGNIRVSNGNKISNSLNIQIIKDTNPLIFNITTDNPLYADIGESITINGVNFTANSVNVSFDGISQQATILSDTELSVVVPQDAKSGELRVVANGISNPYNIEIRKGTSGVVKLPTASTLQLDKLKVEFLGSSQSSIAQDGSFTLATRNRGVSSISIFAPQLSGHRATVFLSATVLPNQTSIEINPLSTAVDFVYSAMGLESSIHKDDQEKAIDIVKNSVGDFANFLDDKLGKDSYYLETMSDEFREQYLRAIESAGKSLDQALNSGEIRHSTKTNLQTRSLKQARANSTGSAKITPREKQNGFKISFQKSGDTYNGKINIENDTMLFADKEITNAYNDKTIVKSINSYFSAKLIGSQTGFWSFYWANTSDENLKHQSANIVIYTPGLKNMPSWNIYRNTPSYKLAIRTVVNQAIAPIISTFIGVKFTNSMTDKILQTLFDYGALDGLEVVWTTGTVSGYADGIGLILKRGGFAMIEAIVKDIAPDIASGKLISHLMIKLTPLGSAATALQVGGTAMDLLNLANDMVKTPSQIKYRAIFPISVTSVEPSVIIKDSEVKEIKLKGTGLAPVVKSSIRFGDTKYNPLIEFVDKNDKKYEDDMPEYNHGVLKSSLPVDYVLDAKDELSVTLHHHLIDDNFLEDDVIDVDLDTQFKIKIVDKLTISSIEPNKGAWGDIVKINGAGFSDIISDNAVFFTIEDSGVVKAQVTTANSTELTVVVPKDSITGDVIVSVTKPDKVHTSNKLPFTVDSGSYTFSFGDNGSANDDTFALYIDGQHIRTMPRPTRNESVTVPLSLGRHSVELHGITAPDDVGTYFIAFPNGVSMTSGDATSGRDLTAGVVKSWIIDATQINSKSSRSLSFGSKSMPKIMWQE